MFYDEITVGQFCHFYIEDTEKVRIWSLDQEKTVYEGSYGDAIESEYADEAICSFGIEEGIICINVQ